MSKQGASLTCQMNPPQRIIRSVQTGSYSVHSTMPLNRHNKLVRMWWPPALSSVTFSEDVSELELALANRRMSAVEMLQITWDIQMHSTVSHRGSSCNGVTRLVPRRSNTLQPKFFEAPPEGSIIPDRPTMFERWSKNGLASRPPTKEFQCGLIIIEAGPFTCVIPDQLPSHLQKLPTEYHDQT